MPISCVDIEGWYNSEGPAYNCEWYESSAGGGGGGAVDANCRLHGSDPYKTNFSRTAAEACCACGGGIREMKATTTFNQHHSFFPLINSDEVEDRRTASDISNSNAATKRRRAATGTIGSRATASTTSTNICAAKFRPCLSLKSCGSGYQQFSGLGVLPSPTCWNLIIWQFVLALVLMNVETLLTVLVKMQGWLLSARRGRTESSSRSRSTYHVGNKIHKKNKEDVPPEVEYFEDNPRREEHTIKKVQHKKESTLPNNHVTSAMDSVNSLSDRTAMLFGLRPVSRQIKRSQQQGVEESVVSYASSSAVGSLESFPFPERSPSAEEEKTSVSFSTEQT